MKFNKNIKIILAGRLLKDKGIDEYLKLSQKTLITKRYFLFSR